MTTVRSSRTPGRRRRVLASVCRSALTTVLLLVVYYRAPLDRPADVRVALWLAVGIAGLSVAVAWQARAIAASDMPRLQAVETAAVGLPALLLLYASAYAVLSHGEPTSFTEVLDRTDALYYTMTVFATVGFGDIAPTAQTTRIVTMTQMVVGLLAVGLAAKLLLGAVEEAVRRNAARADRLTAQDEQRPD
ncbi:potassium channel family protein [Pseudonocardia broussonetiae]|uniref:Two pore domain potassium channel family protein n=1 Tax=Pseudonocardia broussonetiae TaxID=2736640 RepID=A0A6M6JPI0_9PSEU|nr:potassium channel family protein [Pseudonocardia broussonetiae]QJY49206.1 two pore domain potassium channel family protein [Pseudonocardia broussonetiae]